MFTRIYALAVCFSSILCIAVSTGVGLYDVVQLMFPVETMDAHRYESLNASPYSNFYPGTHFYPAIAVDNSAMQRSAARASAAAADVKELTEQELVVLKEKRWQAAINNTRHDARQSLIQVLVILFVSVPLFFVHWRYARHLDEPGRTVE